MKTSVNNKCRAFTSLEQSKKLAEILPLESADMWLPYYYDIISDTCEYNKEPMLHKPICDPDKAVPCWSLAALLEIIGNIRTVYERMVTIEVGKYAGNKWYVELVFVMTESKALMTYTNELINACYEMILKLHEQKLI